MSEETLEIRLAHSFPGFRLDLDVAAPPGLTALFGRSGAGKTTVVNAIAGLLTPQSGRIALGAQVLLDTERRISLPRHRRRVGYVFQEARLFPHLSVRRNLLFGRRFAPRAARGPGLDEVVSLLGIGHLLARAPVALSGGEAQRVAIGRALLSAPRLLLMDEPLAALDNERRAEILPYIERLRDSFGLPIVYVSHSVPEIARLATTIIALEAGRAARAGPAPEILSDPASFPLLGRQEAGAVLTATIRAHEADGLSRLEVSGGTLLVPRVGEPPGTRLRVRIRARDVILAREAPVGLSALNALPATVDSIGAEDGPIVEVALRAGDDRILARITRRSLRALDLEPGCRCHAVLKSVAIGRRDLGGFEPNHNLAAD